MNDVELLLFSLAVAVQTQIFLRLLKSKTVTVHYYVSICMNVKRIVNEFLISKLQHSLTENRKNIIVECTHECGGKMI